MTVRRGAVDMPRDRSQRRRALAMQRGRRRSPAKKSCPATAPERDLALERTRRTSAGRTGRRSSSGCRAGSRSGTSRPPSSPWAARPPVGNELLPSRPPTSARGEAVVRRARIVRDSGMYARAGSSESRPLVRQDAQRAAAMRGTRRADPDPQRAVDRGQARRPVADAEPLGHARSGAGRCGRRYRRTARSPRRHRGAAAIELGPLPTGSVARTRARCGIDPRDRAVEAVRDPHRAGGDRDAARRRRRPVTRSTRAGARIDARRVRARALVTHSAPAPTASSVGPAPAIGDRRCRWPGRSAGSSASPVLATQTAPGAARRRSDRCRPGRCTTRSVRRIHATVPSRLLATQTAPSATAMPAGRAAVPSAAPRGSASIRETLSPSALVTHTARTGGDVRGRRAHADRARHTSSGRDRSQRRHPSGALGASVLVAAGEDRRCHRGAQPAARRRRPAARACAVKRPAGAATLSAPGRAPAPGGGSPHAVRAAPGRARRRARRPAPAAPRRTPRGRPPGARSGTARASAARAGARAAGARRPAPRARPPARRAGRAPGRRRCAARAPRLCRSSSRAISACANASYATSASGGPRHSASASRSERGRLGGPIARQRPAALVHEPLERSRSSSPSATQQIAAARVCSRCPSRSSSARRSWRCDSGAPSRPSPAALSPHSASISRSLETASLRCSRSRIKTLRLPTLPERERVSRR